VELESYRSKTSHPMKRFIPACMALAASLLASSAAYAATPVTDCPLRDAPFSIESPLVDILLSPVAIAVTDKAGAFNPATLRRFDAVIWNNISGDVLTLSQRRPEGFGHNLRMGDHPVAWTRCIGKGRMFYSAIGHRPETYSEPHYVAMLEMAIDWAAVSGKADCPSGNASATPRGGQQN
jgi:Trehalose utilisation